jgi:hypothetical protein
MASGEPVGEFFVHVLAGQEASTEIISSKRLLTGANQGKPTVIHFYDGG